MHFLKLLGCREVFAPKAFVFLGPVRSHPDHRTIGFGKKRHGRSPLSCSCLVSLRRLTFVTSSFSRKHDAKSLLRPLYRSLTLKPSDSWICLTQGIPFYLRRYRKPSLNTPTVYLLSFDIWIPRVIETTPSRTLLSDLRCCPPWTQPELRTAGPTLLAMLAMWGVQKTLVGRSGGLAKGFLFWFMRKTTCCNAKIY